MMKSFLMVLLSMMFFLNSCEKDNDPMPSEPADLGLSLKITDMIRSDNVFGIDLFKEIVNQDTSENIFISPMSISLALAMTYNGAEGTTKAEMEDALRKAGLTREEINAGYSSMVEALLSVDSRVILEIANSIWYRPDFTVLPDFINVNQEYYHAEVNSIEFNLQGKDLINRWASRNTHGKIEEILDQIPADAVMYLINAIYFKGMWKYEFDPSKTTDMPFKVDNINEVSVQMMKQEATLNYFSNDILSMVELPYGRGNFTMVVLLPNAENSIDDISSVLTDENWDSWIAGFQKITVDLSMPQLKFKYKTELSGVLSAMGMPSAFGPLADFSGINGTGGIYISRVLHNTFVEVNEEGTEAAAVTAVEIMETSLPPSPLVFKVDKPFIFAIRETTTGAVLFIGVVRNPLP